MFKEGDGEVESKFDFDVKEEELGFMPQVEKSPVKYTNLGSMDDLKKFISPTNVLPPGEISIRNSANE